jgi:hypothetical protein
LQYLSMLAIEQAWTVVDQAGLLVGCAARLKRRATPPAKNDALGKACAGSFQQQKVEYKTRREKLQERCYL